MCGRYVQSRAYREYQRYLQTKHLDVETAERPSWNIAPSTTSLLARRQGNELVLDRLTWGLHGPTELISNARIETAADKPTFSRAWREARGIVPVDGWYEWQLDADGSKQPFFFAMPDGEPVLLAALYNLDRFTLITAETHGPLRAIHSRRPVAISLNHAREWCDLEKDWSAATLEAALVPEESYEQRAVGSAVNSTRNDGAELISPRKAELRQDTLPL